MNARDLLFNLLGKETVSPAAKKAGDALEDLGDEMSETARAAKKLDQQIDEVQGSLRGLAQQYALTGDKEFVKQIRAQEAELRRLTKARKLLGDSPDDSKKAGLRIGANLVEGIAQGLSRVGGPVAAALSNVFGTLPPQAQVAIGGSIVAAIGMAAPAIGAAVSGAVLAGVGSGAVAAGVVAAFQDPRIKGVAQDVGNDLKNIFQGVGFDFAGNTVAALRAVRAAVNSLGLREALAPAAGYLRPLTEGLIGLVRNTMPGLKSAILAAEEPIKAIGAALPRLGSAFSDLFDMFARHAEAGATALTMLFDVIIVGVKIIQMQIDALATAFEWFDKLPTWVTGWAGAWIDSSKDATESTTEWNTSLDGLRMAVEGAGAATAAATPQITTFAGAMKEAGYEADWLLQQMNRLNGGFVSLHQAEANYQEALDQFTESLKRNGATFTANTEAGRENIRAYSRLREEAFANAQAQYENLAATGDLIGAQKSANAVLADAKRQFIAAGIAAGGNKQQVEALADEIFGTPKQWKTTFEAATADASAKITGLKKEIRTLTGKTITITTRFVTVGGPRNEGERVPGGLITKYSSGGEVTGGIPGRDSVPAMLMPGEGVLTTKAMKAIGGKAGLDLLNQGKTVYMPRTTSMGASAHRESVAQTIDYDRLGRAVARAMAGAVFRIDDQRGRLVGVYARGG